MPNAFKASDILIPKKNINMNKWSVIACDQYTSEPDYWNDVYKTVGSSESTLNMILPEIYLEDDDSEKKIENIHKYMNEYISSGIFDTYENAMIYVERIQSNGILRAGIVGMIDLEEYDYTKGSSSQVRATEATVIERIPPRIRVRQNALLELPHIMILIDDENKSVIEPLESAKKNFTKLYDFDLMKNSGHLSGYLIDEIYQKQISAALDKLADKDAFNKKYSLENSPVLLYAMGDGNHSLATAKEYYEQLKKNNPEKDFSNHPARYALAEIVNLHSDALEFEAIHRIVTDVDTQKLISEMYSELQLSENNSGQSFEYITANQSRTVSIGNRLSNLTVGSLQSFLDGYISRNGGKIDYIHGRDVVSELAAKPDSIGFILPDMNKNELFPTVIKDGALPRKTFSMGHAQDKRFYMECRKINE